MSAATLPAPALPPALPKERRHLTYWLGAAAVAVALIVLLRLIGNEYGWYAGYFVLQYVVLAAAWNILGGYAGYVNFGAAGFMATGSYTAVVLNEAFGFGVLPGILGAAVVAGLLGLGTGYLTLRLRGVYFSIATLCLSVVLQTLVVNWDYVGGSRGAYIIRPRSVPPFLSYGEYIFVVMLVLAVVAVGIGRTVEMSRLGRGLQAIRDNERAAEAVGVPTLRLKLIATALSGALMGVAGAPLPFYAGYINPEGAFNLAYAVNCIAMPLIGGAGTWLGPVIGAVLLATLQQAATVTISSALNLWIVGWMLVLFVALAPRGILGWFREAMIPREILLKADAVGKRFGGFTALQGIDLELRAGERLGLIGPNGSGKSTFVNCISGDFAAHDGQVTLAGKPLAGLKPHRRARLGLARTFQLPQPFTSLSVLENVRVPLLFSGEAAEASRRALECLEQVELAGKADKLPKELTQVEQRRLELARAIALRPQLLIADEAMAGLSHAEVDQIIALLLRLNAAGTAVIMIEHIMRAVTAFAERLIVFVAGRKIADGPPGEVLALREVEDAYLGRQ